jgi:hypothetical protein
MYKMFPIRPFSRLSLLLITSLISTHAWALSTNQVNIIQKTGPFFIVDHNKPTTGPRAGFVAIEMINISNQPISNFKITLTNIVGTGQVEVGYYGYGAIATLSTGCNKTPILT